MAANSVKESLPSLSTTSRRTISLTSLICEAKGVLVRLAKNRKAETSATWPESVDTYACKTLSSSLQKALYWTFGPKMNSDAIS